MGAIKTAADAAWRDYTIEGVASSGPHEPRKSDIRAVMDEVDTAIANTVANASFIFATKAALDATLTHPENTMAQVQGDPDSLKDGVYRKSGASGAGSWVYVSELPSAGAARAQTRADAIAGTLLAQSIGTSSPAAGAAGASASTYVLRQEAWRAGYVETVTLHAFAAGNLDFGIFSRSGNVFTRIATKTVRVAAGLQTVTLGLPIAAGQYVGFTTTGGVVSYIATAGEGYFAGTLASEAFTDSLASTSLTIQARFDLRGNSAPINPDLLLGFSTESDVIGVAAPLAGTNAVSGTLVLATPTPSDSAIGAIHIQAGASATIDIGLYERVDTTLNRLEILRRTTVAPGVVTTTRIDRAVRAGLYIGFQSATAGWTQFINEPNPGYYYTAATTGDSFVGASINTAANMQIAVEYQALNPAPTHRVGLAQSERVLVLGPSYGAGYYNTAGKNWASKVDLFSRYNVENFSFGGETIALLLDRIRNDTISAYSAIPPRRMNAKYVVICEGYNSETHATNGVSFSAYLEDLRQMAQTVIGMGAVPIICTEWKPVYDPAAQAAVKAVAEQTGAMFVDLVPHTLRMMAGTLYDGFWRPVDAAQHFGVRSNHIVADQIARVVEALPAPRSAIRIHRKRSAATVATVDDLAYRDATERAMLFMPLKSNQVSMPDGDAEYIDALVDEAANYTIETVTKSELLEMQQGKSVALGEYALIEAIIDATVENVDRLSLILSDVAATVYVRDAFASPYPADGDPVYRWTQIAVVDGKFTLDRAALRGRMFGDQVDFLVYKSGGITLREPIVEWIGIAGKPRTAPAPRAPVQGEHVLSVRTFATISGARATGWEAVGGAITPSNDATYQLPYGVTHFVTLSDTLKAVQRLAYTPSDLEDEEVEIVVTARNFPALVDPLDPGAAQITLDSHDLRRVVVELIDQAGSFVMPHYGRVGLWWDEVRFRSILPMRTGPLDLRISGDGPVQVARAEVRRVRASETISAGMAQPSITWHRSVVATPSALVFYIASGGSDVVASDDHGKSEAKAFATFSAALVHALNTVRFTDRLARVTFAFGPGEWGQLAVGSNLAQSEERGGFVIHITSSNLSDWAQFHSITDGSFTDTYLFVEKVRLNYMSVARGRMTGHTVNLIAPPSGEPDASAPFRTTQSGDLYLFGDTTVEEAVTYTTAFFSGQGGKISIENGDVPAIYPAWNLLNPGNVTAPSRYRMVQGAGIYLPSARYAQLTFATAWHVDASSWSTQTMSAPPVDIGRNTGLGGPIVYRSGDNANGYSLRADGWCEAWGQAVITGVPAATTSGAVAVTLPVTMSSASYHVVVGTDGLLMGLAASGRTTTGFNLHGRNVNSAAAESATLQWTAKGRIAP